MPDDQDDIHRMLDEQSKPYSRQLSDVIVPLPRRAEVVTQPKELTLCEWFGHDGACRRCGRACRRCGRAL